MSSVSEDTSVQPPKKDLGLLEDDDEFEEFPSEEWSKPQEDKEDINVWEDNWDDDTVEDDFSVQLSKHRRKRPASHTPPIRSPSPAAKKLCSRLSAADEPMEQDNRVVSNKEYKTNGASNGSTTPSPRSRNSKANARNSTPPTPTRSSARLRSSKK